MTHGGTYPCLVWRAFAERGMGFGASTTGADDRAPTEAFDVPPACATAGTIWLDRPAYGCGGAVCVTVIDGNAPPTVAARITTVFGDDETVALACSTTTLTCTGAATPILIVTTPVDVVPGNSRLEILEGDAIQATYDDASPPQVASDIADIRCLARVALAGHRVAGECDVDQVAGYPELPGFLDASESATLELRLRNDEPFDLTNVRVSVASGNPAVRFPGTTTTAIATLPARIGAAAPERIARFAIVADATVRPGDTAAITVDFTADGYRASAIPLALSLGLDHDYRRVPDELLFRDDLEGATAPTWTHAAVSGPDEWSWASCTSNSPTHSWQVGDPSCIGSYQLQISYVSTPTFRPTGADAAAFRLARLGFAHLSTLLAIRSSR